MTAIAFRKHLIAILFARRLQRSIFLSKNHFYTRSLYGLIISITTFSNLCAQAVDSLPSVRSLEKRNVGVIQSGNVVEGYYVLYTSEKKDMHTSEYTMIAYDSNLNRVGRMVFPIPEKEVLLETVAVDNKFIFLCMNDKRKMVITNIYNWQGSLQKTYTKKLDVNSQYYLEKDFNGLSPGRKKNKYLIAFDRQQFLTLIPTKKGQKFTYEVTVFSAESDPVTYSPNENIKLAQADYIGSTDSLLLFNLVTKKELIDNKYEPWLLGVDKRTATSSFLSSNSFDNFHYYLTSAIQAPGGNHMMVLGTYFKKGKILKAPALGVCTAQINSSGQIIHTGLFSWDKEIAKYLDVVDTGGINDFGNLYIHDLVPTANGNSFIIAEGYKKTVNDAAASHNELAFFTGIATGLLTGLSIRPAYRDAFDFTLTDLALLEIDSSYSLKNIEPFFKEEHTTATTNNTAVKTNRIRTGRHLAGAFDYDFVKPDNDYRSFEIGYKRYEQTETKESGNYYIIHNRGGKNQLHRLELNSTADELWGMAAIHGFVLIAEHFLASEKFRLRLIKSE